MSRANGIPDAGGRGKKPTTSRARAKSRSACSAGLSPRRPSKARPSGSTPDRAGQRPERTLGASLIESIAVDATLHAALCCLLPEVKRRSIWDALDSIRSVVGRYHQLYSVLEKGGRVPTPELRRLPQSGKALLREALRTLAERDARKASTVSSVSSSTSSKES